LFRATAPGTRARASKASTYALARSCRPGRAATASLTEPSRRRRTPARRSARWAWVVDGEGGEAADAADAKAGGGRVKGWAAVEEVARAAARARRLCVVRGEGRGRGGGGLA